jgi:hypothetical protein
MSNLASNQGPPPNQAEDTSKQERGFFDRLKGFLSNYRIRKFCLDPRVWLEFAALIVLVWYTWYAGKQSGTMNNTLAEIRKQTCIAKQGADAATTAAKAAQDGISESRNNRVASETQSKAALDASIESSRTDQRPWVSIVRWKLSEDPSSGKDFAIIIGPINTGKTPALSLTMISQLSIWPEEPSPTDLEAVVVKAGKTPNSIGMLPPSVGAIILDFHYATDPWRLDASQVEAYRARTQRIYLETLVKYTDAFGWRHRTRVCAYHSYGMPLDELSLCRQGNSMDDH